MPRHFERERPNYEMPLLYYQVTAETYPQESILAPKLGFAIYRPTCHLADGAHLPARLRGSEARTASWHLQLGLDFTRLH